jgi:biotin transport system substrate-specific component
MDQITPSAVRNAVFASLMTALIVVGAYIAVPVPASPVPVVLQNLFVLLAGLLLGWKWGLISVALYLVMGAVGLPVFSAARGGMAHLLGPTGGYLIGFIPGVMIVGAIAETRRHIAVFAAAGLLGTATIYAFGVPWLMASGNLRINAALGVGVVPFIVPDLIKVAVAAAVARAVDATEIPLPREDTA